MPRTPEQYKEIRNEKKSMIMKAALVLFANEGFHATSISKIAKKANISKGLIYNYFESKEDLLKKLMLDLTEEVIDMINPDHDDVITKVEALEFFDKFIKMLKNKREEMKLYFQLTIQPCVIDLYMKSEVTEKAMHNQKLLFNYFTEHSNEKPEVVLTAVSSILKGFSLQYVLAPEMFPDELIEEFKKYFMDLFINTKNK